MKKEIIEGYKKKLELERILVNKEIQADSKPADFGSDIDHMEEESDKTEDFGNQLAAVNSLKERITEIDIAIAKIAEGTYGFCEICKNEIEVEILDIDPESRFCKRCKLQKQGSL